MDPIAFERISHLIEGQPAEAGSTTVVAIDGPSGSGKSTLATRLSQASGVPVLRLDDIYRGWDGLVEATRLLADEVLDPLSRGLGGSFRRYAWTSGRLGPKVSVPATSRLIVDGVGSGSLVCAPYLSALIWVEADLVTRKARGLARDGETYAPYWDRWAAQENRLFAADETRRRADIVVAGEDEGGILGATSTERGETHGQDAAK